MLWYQVDMYILGVDILGVNILRLTCIVFAGIETLPQELQRNFTLMRDLDQRAEGKITKKWRRLETRSKIMTLSD